MIKNILLVLCMLTFSLMGSAVFRTTAYAAYSGPFDSVCNGVSASDSSVCSDKAQGQSTSNNYIYGPNSILTKVVNLLSLLIGIVAVIVIIITGIRFILSGGDPTKVASARSTILYALVGLVVAALAQSIIIFVLNKL